MVFESQIEKLTQKYSEHLQTAFKNHADQESIMMILNEYREKCSTYQNHEVFYYKQIAESHGECVCDTNPETTDGPDEFCPMHGRRYSQVVEMLDDRQAKINQIANTANYWKTFGNAVASIAVSEILKIISPPANVDPYIPPAIKGTSMKVIPVDMDF